LDRKSEEIKDGGGFQYSGFGNERNDMRPFPTCRDLNHPQMTLQAQIDALGGQPVYDAMLRLVTRALFDTHSRGALFAKAEW
jgi:hypothetical protein